MLPGPVFYTELLTTARRARYYWLRFLYCLILLFSIWSIYELSVSNPDEMSIQEISSFASSMFATIAMVQVLAVIALAPALVAGTIADESQRKTLHYLLSSRLTSGEIVLGKLLARILHIAVFVALGVPIVSMLTLLGGVDPTIVQLTYLGSFTLLFFIAGLSILISTYTARPRDAIARTYVFLFAWFVTPFLARTLSSVYPAASYLDPYIAFLDSWANPLGLYFSVMANSPGQMVALMLWKSALQFTYGALFAAWATWRLRPVYRARQDSIGAATSRWKRLLERVRSFRFIKPRPCGDDPILWKELFFRRTSLAAKILGAIVLGPLIVYYIGFTIYISSVAWNEMYGTGAATGWLNGREGLNAYSRFFVAFFYSFAGLATAVAAAGSFTSERERDTFFSLAATPLAAKDVVFGKTIGAAWSARWIWLLIGLTMIPGLITFSLSWRGLVLTWFVFVIFIWFIVALGTFLSLQSRTTARAMGLTIGLLVFMNGGYLFCWIPLYLGGLDTDFNGIILSGCTPAVIFFTLLDADGAGFADNSSIFRPEIFCILSVIGYGVLAAILTATSLLAYDRACDRPRRSENP